MVESMALMILQNYGVLGFGVIISIFAIFKWDTFFIPRIKRILRIGDKSDRMKLIKTRNILINKLSFWVRYKVDTLEMKNRARTEIFRDLIKFRLQSFLDEFTDESFKYFLHIDGELSYRELLNLFTEVRDRSDEKAKAAGIPDIVIEKFNQWTNPTIQYTLRSAELVLHSGVYDTNTEKMTIIYSLMTSMLELVILEAEKALSILNGELDGIEYKGYTC